MKRWNWPTTILYIKHKKANLKQRCSKLVGKKRKAPSEGWSGGLNCPIGTGEEMHWHVPLGASGAAGARHYPGRARQRGPGRPGPRRSHRPEPTQSSRAGYSFKKLSGGGRSPKSRRPGSPRYPPSSFLPGAASARPLPLRPPRTGHRGARRKATRVL